jgi:hypothetical protein
VDGVCRKHEGDHEFYRIEFTNPRDKKVRVLDECGWDNAHVLLKQKRPLSVHFI